MKNKKIIFVFCILYSSLCSKAQLGETAFHLNSSFNHTVSNPVYLIREVNQDEVCVIQEYFGVEIIPNHTLKSNNDLLNIAPCNSTTIFTSFTSSSANFTTDCP